LRTDSAGQAQSLAFKGKIFQPYSRNQRLFGIVELAEIESGKPDGRIDENRGYPLVIQRVFPVFPFAGTRKKPFGALNQLPLSGHLETLTMARPLLFP
jgi:hypothetical protein